MSKNQRDNLENKVEKIKNKEIFANNQKFNILRHDSGQYTAYDPKC